MASNPDLPLAASDVREGIVVVVQCEGRYLMIRRAAGILAGGAWCFVGGGVEAGESQEAAVVREFLEEVGGVVTPIRKVWEYTRPDGRLRLHWWLAEMGECVLTPNPMEVAELRWCHLSEIEALPELLESNRQFLAVFEAGEAAPRNLHESAAQPLESKRELVDP